MNTCRKEEGAHGGGGGRLAAFGDPRDLQAALGHSNLKLTMGVYRKPIATRQQADADELEALLAGKVVPIKVSRGA
jgi:integrase